MTIQAVTIDAYGTLVTLRDPVPSLRAALAARGVDREPGEVERAFRAEVAYYVPRSHEGRDETTLALLRRRCTRVFLETAGANLAPDEFTAAFLHALVFEAVPGASAACQTLAEAGLRLAVVSNWDVGLHDQLEELGLTASVDEVVTSAEAGAPKPDPRVFQLALGRLHVAPQRAVHVGDGPEDEEGARAAGLRFEPAPLADAARRILA
jgi:HAD superfamily hydrolase (TIGR01509 family)